MGGCCLPERVIVKSGVLLVVPKGGFFVGLLCGIASFWKGERVVVVVVVVVGVAM